MALKTYPTMIIPTEQIAINVPRSFGLITFFSMMSDGRLSVVTAIIKLRYSSELPSSPDLPLGMISGMKKTPQ